VLHQSKPDALSAVQATYDDAGIPAQTLSFIDDTATAFRNTDLVICRSGATTVAELTVMGLPAVFLPYPHHADHQQEKNAAPMRDAGAAVVIDEKRTGVAELEAAIAAFVCDRDKLQSAADASRALGRPQAASVIVDRLMELVGRR
jgi:UDP-N-acetylglucosamine--N-acetylmuramyl-(pentapeptide) pyrophosphoryl-undecaprenol N-acetylglucosamine transferase